MKNVDIITDQKSHNGVSFDSSSREGREKKKMTTILKSEKGVVLIMVIVLSAVVLAIMTALIYMITSGTQISGFQKRYKTSLEAAKGGSELFYQFVALRGVQADDDVLKGALIAAGVSPSLPIVTSACTGMSGGSPYTGLTAKLMSPTTSWVNCNSNLYIDPTDSTTYDMMFQLGATTRYNFYAKIVQTIDGNSGGDLGLLNKGVVSGGSGEITVMSKPYLYAVEIVAENSANVQERAKLSILYQY
jgi:hypothetical protein